MNLRTGKALLASTLLAGLVALSAGCAAWRSGPRGPSDRPTVERIAARGALVVGSTGDYRPLTWLDPETGRWEGFGIEVAERIAAELGVRAEFVRTSWPTLARDVRAEPPPFDLAIGGITVTEARRESMAMSDGYLANGKTILCRAADAGRFRSLADIDRPDVRVMVNPGGLNEAFARERLPNARLLVHARNEEIPALVAEGRADVMVTEIVEAPWYARSDPRLAAPLLAEPFTRGEIGVLMRKGQDDLLAFVNGVLARMAADGTLDSLKAKHGLAPAPAALPSWNEGAPARAALVEYVEAVTDPDGPDFIPPEGRVAVFDLDGTLFCETDPNYFDYTLLVHRVAEDPGYRDRASEAERETVRKILEMNATGVAAKGLETDHGRAVASAFAGFTLEEFDRYVQAFKKLPMPSYDGMARGEGWYRPMLEVADYLAANGFQVWVVSGTDRFIVRGIVSGSPLAVPPERIIGSDEAVAATGQDGADGLGYQLREGDEVVLEGRFVVKNLKMNKVSAIVREIGRRPVLAFGNSTGDSSMAAWATRGNPRRALAFMLCCDDTERENGNPAKAAKMRALCAENGWIPVSMKDDWKTIYGDGVSRKPVRAE